MARSFAMRPRSPHKSQRPTGDPSAHVASYHDGNGQSDYYSNVVSYVVRAQDVRPDGTVRATASDTGIIHQNDTDSQGGGNQGVNTEVSQPCIQLFVQCTGNVGENGAITFTGPSPTAATTRSWV